jgi:hypothetical protein
MAAITNATPSTGAFNAVLGLILTCVFACATFGQEKSVEQPLTTEEASLRTAAKITLFKGSIVTGVVIDCSAGDISLDLTAAANGQLVMIHHRFHCADVANVRFDNPDAVLQRKIVNEAVSVGNGMLAYNVACSMPDDPDMRAISTNPAAAKAAANCKAALADYMAATDEQAKLSALPNPTSSAPRGGRSAPSRSAPSASLAAENIRIRIDQAKSALDKTQTALATMCKNALGGPPSEAKSVAVPGSPTSSESPKITEAGEFLHLEGVPPICTKHFSVSTEWRARLRIRGTGDFWLACSTEPTDDVDSTYYGEHDIVYIAA